MLMMRPALCRRSPDANVRESRERPAKVRFEDAIPNFRRQRIELTEWDAHVPGRVVYENIDPSKVVDYVFAAQVDRFEVSLIELHGVALPASPSHRFDHCLSATNLTYIGNGNIGAGSSKSLGNCFSNVT
jgi:hypothetical protein